MFVSQLLKNYTRKSDGTKGAYERDSYNKMLPKFFHTSLSKLP